MRTFLRFFFTDADQGRIDSGSVQVSDVAPSTTPQLDQPYPQSLQISFTVSDPDNGPLQIRPLFPGRLTFLADDAAAGTVPDPDDVEFTSDAYATWKTTGAVAVRALPATFNDMATLASAPEVVPNVAWFAPLVIPEAFLFTSLRTGLQKARIPATGGTSTIGTGDPNWDQHAVARFLGGRYSPKLRLKATAAEDDVVTQPMPTVVMASDGKVTLTVTTAFARRPQDAKNREFDTLAATLVPGAEALDPVHPRNGVMPARHVYRSFRSDLIDAAAGKAVPDAILADWPNAPRYFPIRCTRTWKPIENCSIHFPSNSVTVENAAGDAVLFAQRLPAHGIAYLPQSPATPEPAAPEVTVSFTGGLRWLDGATADAWKAKADTTVLDVDLSATPTPHLILRRTMSEEMLVERRYAPGGMRCTYLSLRRGVRALIDHRITGGRLNFGPNRTGKVTRQLIDDAWTGAGARSTIVANNRPRPNAAPGNARNLEPVLEAFFPEDAPDNAPEGTDPPDPADIKNKGEMAYALWQTILAEFRSNGSGRFFSDAHIGRGGPGALVAVDLAGAFHVDPARNTNEADTAYFDRIVGDMVTGLEPGALLQFWNLSTDFDSIKARSSAVTSYGHSPVFLRYEQNADGDVTGFVVIDQFGESLCPVAGAAPARTLQWDRCPRANPCPAAQQIWIAANWSE